MNGNGNRPDLPDGLDGQGAGAAVMARRRGSASVTLRRRAGEDGETDGLAPGGFDPATKSLADALKITYRLLQLAMVVLAALYILSGFQSVKESERGIRLLFGKVQDGNLGSGFQFSFPAPVGELVKVPVGLQSDDINNAFFPRLSDAEEKQITDKDKGAQSLADGGSDALDPDADGQLLTADGNIVHARWTVNYQRTDARRAVGNINPDYERKIVTAAACQGIVHAAARLPIDDILKKQVDSSSTSQQLGTSKIELLAKRDAQAALDRCESGISISQLAMTMVIPPRKVMKQFEEVQAAQSNKSTLVENANTQRNDTLTQTAGRAAEPILAMIEQYERELGLGEKDKAAATLDKICKLMLNQPVDGVERPADQRTSGRVTAILSEARQYRTSVVNDAKGEAAYFDAKRKLFESNPLVMIHGDWSDAFESIMARDAVQTMWLPPGTARQVLQINRDPRIAAENEMKLNEADALKAAEQRRIQRERDRFQQRTDTAPKVREN